MSGPSTLGVLETRGTSALLAGADAMCKAAAVEITGSHRVGSGWVTVTVEGETGAVQTALEAGRGEARRNGEIICVEIVVRPDTGALRVAPHPRGLRENPPEAGRALGVLETQGLAPLFSGVDAMCKAAAVDLHGWTPIGGALCHAVVRGGVHDVREAVASGRAAAEREGSVHATLVLPVPSPGLEALLPAASASAPSSLDAFGILETTGYLGAAAGADAMTKTAEVELLRFILGSGGRVGVLLEGRLEEVQSALRAGENRAREAGEYNARCAVARPDPGAVACFGGARPDPPNPRPGEGAVGLIETRSTVALVTAVDQMMKTADVLFEGRWKVGAYNTAAVIRGPLASVRVALDVGDAEARLHGESVHTHLIPVPLPELERRLMHAAG